jgi:hypothetical protein
MVGLASFAHGLRKGVSLVSGLRFFGSRVDARPCEISMVRDSYGVDRLGFKSLFEFIRWHFVTRFLAIIQLYYLDQA